MPKNHLGSIAFNTKQYNIQTMRLLNFCCSGNLLTDTSSGTESISCKTPPLKGDWERAQVMCAGKSDFCAHGAVRNCESAQHLISWLYCSSFCSRKSSHRYYIYIGIRIQWRVSRIIDNDCLIYRIAWIFGKLFTRHLSFKLQEKNQSGYKEEKKVSCMFVTN